MVTAGVLTPNTPDFHPVVTGRGRFGLVRLEVTRIDSRYQNIPMGGVGIVSRIWAYLKVQVMCSEEGKSTGGFLKIDDFFYADMHIHRNKCMSVYLFGRCACPDR